MIEVISDVPRESAACPESNEDQTGAPPNTWRGHLRHFAAGTGEQFTERMREMELVPLSMGSACLNERGGGSYQADLVVVVFTTSGARQRVDALTCEQKNVIERNMLSRMCKATLEVTQDIRMALSGDTPEPLR